MILDERSVVSRVDRLTKKDLRLWVRIGWVQPALGRNGPHYDEVDLARIRLLCELKQDLRLSKKTLAVVLPLIDRLHQTRRELRMLAEAVGEQPEEVRRVVVSTVRDKMGHPETDGSAERQQPAEPGVAPKGVI